MSARLGTVLVIDDEDIDQRQYKRILERSGLTDEIIQFTYADEALAWLVTHPEKRVDLIFLDVNIPRMTGIEFLAEASRQLPDFSAPVIIMLTTSLNPMDRENALAFGPVRGFFNKPLTPAHLLDAARILQEPA